MPAMNEMLKIFEYADGQQQKTEYGQPPPGIGQREQKPDHAKRKESLFVGRETCSWPERYWAIGRDEDGDEKQPSCDLECAVCQWAGGPENGFARLLD